MLVTSKFVARWIRSIVFCVTLLGLSVPLFADGLAGSRPNIVFIMPDDHGYGEIARHGNDIIQTPHLDRLHDRSLRFTDYHVSPTCSPTRASFMSGKHEFKNGVTHTLFERERLALSTVTIAQVLQKSGYSTGIFGKWHLGDEDEYQPNHRGFDEVYIHGGGGIGQTYPGSCGDAPNNYYFNPAILHNGVFERATGYCTDAFFVQATKWIDEQRKTGKPFFAYITPNAPHDPYHSPQDKWKLYADNPKLTEDEKAFYGMISNIDDNVGTLLAQLAEWGIDKNTLFIFTTDNGSALGQYYNAGMKGRKGTPYQGGTRVPMFAYWAGRLEPGEAKQLTAHIDMYATFAELAGAPIPAGVKLDGRSLLPIYQNKDADWSDRFLFTHLGRWAKGKASESKYGQCAVRTARFRLINNTELYDISTDPSETINVIDRFPEEVARMRAAYDAWWEEILPCLVNEDAIGPPHNPFKVRFWKQFGMW